MTIEKLFVPYNIAVKLKELDFDEPCFATYWHSNKKLNGLPLTDMAGDDCDALHYNWQNSKIHPSIVTAPLYDQVEQWLIDKDRICVYRFGLTLWKVRLPRSIEFQKYRNIFYGEIFSREDAITEVLKIIVAKI